MSNLNFLLRLPRKHLVVFIKSSSLPVAETTPQCWRTLYHLLALYSTMPEPKTVSKRCDTSRLSVIHEEPDHDSRGVRRAAGRIEMEEFGNTRERLDSMAADEEKMDGKFAQTSFNRTSFKQSTWR